MSVVPLDDERRSRAGEARRAGQYPAVANAPLRDADHLLA